MWTSAPLNWASTVVPSLSTILVLTRPAAMRRWSSTALTGLTRGVCTSWVKRASTPEVLPVAVKFRVFTALLAVRLVLEMSAGTPPEFSRAVTRESTAEIAAAVA